MLLAHAGHWTTSLLYLAPVLVVAIALARAGRRDRREGRDRDAEDLAADPTLDDIMDGEDRVERGAGAGF